MPDFGRRKAVPALLAGTALFVFGVNHFRHIVDAVGKREFTDLLVVNVTMFVYLALSLVLALSHRDVAPSTTSRRLRVAVVITVFNEDPVTFLEALRSLAAQTMLPTAIWVIDDGSKDPACRKAFETWRTTECPAEIVAHFQWQPNAGKRHAQGNAFAAETDADIFMTMDSDTVLDLNAIRDGVAPFANPRVMSVAGMILGLNHSRAYVHVGPESDEDGNEPSRARRAVHWMRRRRSHHSANALAMLSDFGTVVGALAGRAFWSQLGSVPVNSGALSFYRTHVVVDNLEHYLTQTVMGRAVQTGDDAMLTHYALLNGHAVFQSSSRGYTLMPEKIKHLSKQRVRWWRSYFWSSVWVLWRFPVYKPIWWMRLWSLMSFAFMTGIIPWVIVIAPLTGQSISWGLAVIAVMLCYMQASLYLTVRREDMPLRRQVVMFLASPAVFVANVYLIWVLQYIGLFTFAKTGWSTRTQVEVGLGAGAGAETAEAVEVVPEVVRIDAATEKFRPVTVDSPTAIIRPVRPVPTPAPAGSLAAVAKTLRFRPVGAPPAASTQRVRPVELPAERTSRLEPVAPPARRVMPAAARTLVMRPVVVDDTPRRVRRAVPGPSETTQVMQPVDPEPVDGRHSLH